VKLRMALIALCIGALGALGALFWYSPLPPKAPRNQSITQVLSAPSGSVFQRVARPVTLQFPRDHGPHWQYQTEWWYFTGNLRSVDKPEREFGYQLTFFRLANAPVPASEQALHKAQIMMAHFAISDIQSKQFHQAERFARIDGQLAKINAAPLLVQLDDWRLRAIAENMSQLELHASTPEFALTLALADQHGLVLQGDRGFSAKTLDGMQASAYYSMPRWQSQGRIRVGEMQFEVTGTSWFDREFSSSQLSPDQVGWCWFALHLQDGRDVMLYLLRRRDGSMDPASAGSVRALSGAVQRLTAQDIVATSGEIWRADDGAAYPTHWQLQLPNVGKIQVSAKMPNQYFQGQFRYWEGAVHVSGDVAGEGYMEQTATTP
jgi:predicted secreted hydrolase